MRKPRKYAVVMNRIIIFSKYSPYLSLILKFQCILRDTIAVGKKRVNCDNALALFYLLSIFFSPQRKNNTEEIKSLVLYLMYQDSHQQVIQAEYFSAHTYAHIDTHKYM